VAKVEIKITRKYQRSPMVERVEELLYGKEGFRGIEVEGETKENKNDNPSKEA
jgi:hypothetical protein